ncbi:MAG: tetratricopeptide repeat protein [Cyanobacteria bacterium P01_G01_bin.39]
MTDNKKTSGQLLFEELAINLDEVPVEQLVNYTAVEYFLTVADEPDSDATNLDKVGKYLESFHHLCEVKAWEKAGQVITHKVSSNYQAELHYQLGIWGYYQEQLSLYKKLLEKLNLNLDFICLEGIGFVYQGLGQHQKAIEYFQKSLNIVDKLESKALKARVDLYSNLAGIYGVTRKSKKAFSYSQKTLEIVREISSNKEEYDREIKGVEARTLGNIGNIYGSRGKFNKAIDYLKKSLTIAQDINNRRIESQVLGNLGTVYGYLKKYEIALDYFEQYLKIAQETNDRSNEASAFGNLGHVYKLKKEYGKAIELQKPSLKIAEEIGDCATKATALLNLGAVYGDKKDYG